MAAEAASLLPAEAEHIPAAEQISDVTPLSRAIRPGEPYSFTVVAGPSARTALAAPRPAGSAVAVPGQGHTALVGAFDPNGTGAAYVFTPSGPWSQKSYLTA